MRLSFATTGLTATSLLALVSPPTLAAPSFKHNRLHQQIAHSSSSSTEVSGDVVNATGAESGPRGHDHVFGPVIFEHKHQRLFKAGPNDAVLREVYHDSDMAKRDAFVYMTKYETIFVVGSGPTGFPHWHFGAPPEGAPTGIGFIPFASLEVPLASSTNTKAVSAAAASSFSVSDGSSSAAPPTSSSASSTTPVSTPETPPQVESSNSETPPQAETSTPVEVVTTTSSTIFPAAVTTDHSSTSTSAADALDTATETDCDEPATPDATSISAETSAIQSSSTGSSTPQSALVTTTAELSVATAVSKSTAVSSQDTPEPSTQIAVPSAKVPGIMQSISYATALATPVALGGQYLGSVTQEPVMEYIPHTNEPIPSLGSDLLGPGINDDLITGYNIFNGSGSLVYKKIDSTEPLTQTPWMSRDNGKGGYLNGQQIFIYADTGVTILANNNAFGGFVSTSVAVDKGRLATQGKAPVLQDMMGEWDDSAAVPRGFVPFTLGEAAYTGQSGKRYAIWPESSLIYLDSETALCYAAIVYIDTHAESLFADVGNTLIKVTVPGIGGPVAHRAVPLMYGADELNFGVLGGIRSWGASGPGGSDGQVYVFGNAGTAGLLLGRVGASQVEDKSAYEYFNNDTQTWSSAAPPKTNPSGFFVEGPYSNADIFYSPRHLTFIMVYQTPYADNNFWWRYLQTPIAIKPSYAGGSDDDIVENLHKYAWSEPALLYGAPKPGNGGYIYAGGVQMGYFDADDIVNGGNKMLLQWTAPVAQDDPRGYDTGTAIVTFA